MDIQLLALIHMILYVIIMYVCTLLECRSVFLLHECNISRNNSDERGLMNTGYFYDRYECMHYVTYIMIDIK